MVLCNRYSTKCKCIITIINSNIFKETTKKTNKSSSKNNEKNKNKKCRAKTRKN